MFVKLDIMSMFFNSYMYIENRKISFFYIYFKKILGKCSVLFEKTQYIQTTYSMYYDKKIIERLLLRVKLRLNLTKFRNHSCIPFIENATTRKLKKKKTN